jgi:hypothetical protein
VARITHNRERVKLTPAERAALGAHPGLADLVEWLLMRDAAWRPAIDRVQGRVAELLAQLRE